MFKNLKNTEFIRQFRELKSEYNRFAKNTPYKIHPNAITISKPISTKEIFRLFQDSSEKAPERELERIEELIGQLLTGELRKLVKDFIQARKKSGESEERENKALELKTRLK